LCGDEPSRVRHAKAGAGLESAGVPLKQAQDMASAFSDTIGETVVTREYLDLRLAELKTEILKWMLGRSGCRRS
jgi:hypothetical protein